MKLKWITNAQNPKDYRHYPGNHSLTYDQYVDWYNQYVKGPPKATEFSVEELEDMGLVGLYKEEDM